MIGFHRNDVTLVSSVDCEQQRQVGKAVLCSIENIVVNEAQTPSEGFRSPGSKNNRPSEQTTATPLDAGFLFAKARSVLRQPPCGTTKVPIGREQQADLLQQAISRFVETGRGQSVYVSGLPGTGKQLARPRISSSCASSNISSQQSMLICCESSIAWPCWQPTADSCGQLKQWATAVCIQCTTCSHHRSKPWSF
jgi:hypothetical protein